MFPDFNSQLTAANNYGLNGTYNKILGFTFTDITPNYNNYSAQQLKDSFDLINIGYAEMTAAQALKLKDYVNLGGAVIVNCDQNMGSRIFQTFGGTGNVGGGDLYTLTNNNAILNGVFGVGTNQNITGRESIGRFTIAQLPPNSTVIGNEITGQPSMFLTGPENRVLFIWDEGIFRNSSVSGTTIDTPQEIVLHNLMTNMIEKVFSLYPTVKVTSPPTACSGIDVIVTATPKTVGTYNYTWTVPSGATIPGNVASFNTRVAGNYSVIITDTATGCMSSSASGLVTINPVPTACLTIENTETCTDETPLKLTFSATGGIPPYIFTYSIDKTTIKSITTPQGSSTVTLTIPTNVSGTFTYELISIRDANSAACD
jgi:hypothetical protein